MEKRVLQLLAYLYSLTFEMTCEEHLVTDELQFGFKKATGCPLQYVVEYFNVRGSSVFATALDITKAFDIVKHSLLFRSLIQAGVPTWIVLLIVNWYSKLSVAVCWNGAISRYFTVKSGARQGSILSPSLFTVFIIVLIVKLRESGDGCIVNNQ